MVGSAVIHAETNKYFIQSMGLNDSMIYSNTMLTVNFELKDALSGTGMILILLP